ncbi:HYC_CC_PP family protein [Flavobacterium sp. JP2137]|uniref:HYC_CC_PP family protein n=1 Tax=Flavobacterium sp. JP2137 TaxID=3414510 RepID=UPI003D2F9ED3
MYNKKWISFLFLLTLLFSNVGLAVNIHYCRGQVEKTSLIYTHDHSDSSCKMLDHQKQEKDCCENPEIKKDSDCCQDQVVSQQFTDKNFVKAFPFQFDLYLIPAPWTPLDSLVYIPQEGVSTDLLFYCDSNAPPLFKLYCQYLLYA